MSTIDDDEEKIISFSAKVILVFWIFLLVISVFMLIGMGWGVVWLVKFLTNLFGF